MISVASSKFSDSAGNTNQDGNDADNSLTLTVDTRATLDIADVTVNEGSPYVVFRIKSSGAQTFSLSLSDQAPAYQGGDNDINAIDAQGAYVDSDYTNAIQIYDGKIWADHSLNETITTPNASSVFLVRVPLINDTVYEGAHAFQLRARRSDNKSVTAMAIIGDAGIGPIFNNSGVNDPKAYRNDDRRIKIDNPIVNEASDYVVFTIKGHGSGSNITLTLQDQNSGDDHTSITTPNLEFWDGNNWQTYSAAIVSGTDFDDSQPLFVRVTITEEQDNTREGSEDFSLLVNATEGSSIGVATIKDDGTGVKYIGTIKINNGTPQAETETNGLDDDYDKDGIPPTAEEALATLAASQGIAGAIGDMNGDGKQDSEQNALATLAWRSVSDFESGNAGTLTDSEAVINIGALSRNSKPDDDNLQIENIRVLDFLDTNSFGINAGNSISTNPSTGEKTVDLATGESLFTTWDPLGFELKPREGLVNLTDIDSQRAGTQAHIYIDTRASNLDEKSVNSFIKFVSQDSIKQAQTSGQPLEDLDGNLIDQEGWYDFTQRRDNTGALKGDGAKLVFDNQGKLQGINLTLTDNRFGDNDPAEMQLSDPGALAFRPEKTKEESKPPKIRVWTKKSQIKDHQKTKIYFRTSKKTDDFELSDIQAKGGGLSKFKEIDKKTYTAIFKPNSSLSWRGKIHVPSKSFSSADGTKNQDGKDQNNTLTIKRIQAKSDTPKEDIYLVLDNSNSMQRSDAKNHKKIQYSLALQALTEKLEDAGFEIQRKDKKQSILFEDFLQDVTKKSAKKMTQSLEKYSTISDQNQSNTRNLNIHLITYGYYVDHKQFKLKHKKPKRALNIMQRILTIETAAEQFGNSIKGNSQWKKLGLPNPNRYDLYQGRSDEPSNLYAGTELLGALEGLEYLLTQKANDTSRRDQSTSIALVLDGRPERRSWWDTRTNSASDSITGLAIPLPESLGEEDITTSGLLYDTKGNPHFFKNNQGQWQWKQMQKDLNSALDLLADVSSDPSKIQVNAYGLNNTGSTSLNATYQDLFSNQSFDNSSSSWSYSHSTIQSLQDLNF